MIERGPDEGTDGEIQGTNSEVGSKDLEGGFEEDESYL